MAEIRDRSNLERFEATNLVVSPPDERDLRERDEQLRDFVENAPIGLHQVGADGTILWANRAELAMLGYAREEYVGHSITEFHVDQAAIANILACLRRGEELHDHEAQLRAKDGSIRHVVVSSNVRVEDGTFLHTRCFTRDITARKLAEQEVRESERQLQLITDALPVLVAFIGPDFRYRFASAAYERWLGHAPAAMIGHQVAEVVGAAAFAAMRPYMEQALAGEPVAYDAELTYPDAVRHVSATYIPQRDGERVTGFVSLVHDISERKQFERYRAAAAARTRQLLGITSALADAVSPDEVFAAVVDHLGSALGASTAALWLVEEDGRTVRLARAYGYSPRALTAHHQVSIDVEQATPAIDAIRRGALIWIGSQTELLRDYPHLAATATPGRAYRVCCLPLASNGRTLGSLGITIEANGASNEASIDAPDAYDEERRFLAIVAGYASQAIERLRLLEAERKSRGEAHAAAARISVLGRASRVFAEARLDHGERLEQIVRELGCILDGCIGISLIEDDGLVHSVATHHPDPAAELLLRQLGADAPVRPGEGIIGSVTSGGRSVLVTAADAAQLGERASSVYRAFYERFPPHALMCAPLRVRDRIIGAVSALRTRAGETYGAEDLDLLEGLAARAAAAIENSRLHHETASARTRAEQLYRFAHAAATVENLEQVFEAALDAIARALGTPRAAILLADEAGTMRFRAWRELSDSYRSAVDGHSPWPRNAVAPEPVLVPDVTVDASLAGYRTLFEREHIGSLAFIPLVARGRLIGKFMVYHGEPHRYSTTEVELAAAIASHLASVTTRFVAVAELERTLHDNELFAGVLAHDLRNPLGAILTAGQMLLMRQEGEGDRNTKPLSRILSSGQRMTRMIDQLLDFTRARVGGGIAIQTRDVNLAELCSQAVGELELVFPDRHIACSFAGDLQGVWDPDRVLQIVSNLVANASQHGEPAGGIAVRCDGASADEVVLEIHNKGAIPPALLANLFAPFRGTSHRRDHSRGLGLGLYIVRELARAHGGNVDVTSSDADGTTFRIRLPRRAGPRPP